MEGSEEKGEISLPLLSALSERGASSHIYPLTLYTESQTCAIDRLSAINSIQRIID